jgi:hypothetical protein
MQVHSRIQSTWWFLYLGDYLSPVCILVYCVILIPVTVPETQRNQFLVSTRYQWNHLVHPIIIHHFPDIIRHPSPSPSPSISVNQGPPSRSPSILAPTRLMMALQSVPAWRWWCSVNRIQHGHTFLHPLGSSFLATSTPLLPQWPPTLWSASLGQRHHTEGDHWSSSVLYWSAISYSTYKDTIQLWLSLCMMGLHRAPLATDNLRYELVTSMTNYYSQAFDFASRIAPKWHRSRENLPDHPFFRAHISSCQNHQLGGNTAVQ